MQEYIIPLIKIIIPLIVLWKACDIMVEGICTISERFKIPQSIAGATLAAISSSAPEFGTSFFAIVVTENGKYPDIGVSTIVGSAIFNVLVIIGLAAAFRKLKVLPRVFSRDGFFYLITVVLLVIGLYDGKITLIETIVALVVYAVYAVILIKDIKNNPEEEGDKSKNKALPLYLAFIYFIVSVVVLAISCHFLVQGTIEISNHTSIPKTLISVLVLAVGTSIPDAFASIAAAKRGKGAMAISNALGSNTFDILICLGLPLFVLNLKGGTYTPSAIPIEKTIVVFSLAFLVSTLVITLIVLRHKWEVSRKKGIFMLFLFFIYVASVILLFFMRDCEWVINLPKLFGF